MDGKTVEFPRSLLGEKIIAILEVYVDDDLSLASMPLVDGNMSSTQNESTCALSSTANYGAEQKKQFGQTVVSNTHVANPRLCLLWVRILDFVTH